MNLTNSKRKTDTMKKLLMSGVATLATVVAGVVAFAEPAKKAAPLTKIHVPTTIAGVAAIDPAVAKANHIALVNVAGAVPAADWSRIATFACSRLQINIWTNSVSASPLPAVQKDPGALGRLFGEKAKVGVFIVDSDEAYPVVAAPGSWARVNIRFLKEDKPDAVTYADRVAKMILKGIAAAAGAGASLDISSANHADTFDVVGLDKRNITLTPDVYFPMLEVLRRAGGDELISPAITEPEEE